MTQRPSNGSKKPATIELEDGLLLETEALEEADNADEGEETVALSPAELARLPGFRPGGEDIATTLVGLPGNLPKTDEPSLLALTDPTLGAIPQRAIGEPELTMDRTLDPGKDIPTSYGKSPLSRSSRIRPEPRTSASAPTAGSAPAQEGATLRLSPHERTGTLGVLPAGLRGQRGLVRDGTEEEPAAKEPFSVRALVLLLSGFVAIVVFGTLAGRAMRSWRLERRETQAQSQAGEARRLGTVSALRTAVDQYSNVLDSLPAHGPALMARAHLLAEGEYEFAEFPEAESAVRLVETESAPDARAAQAYRALSLGNLALSQQLAQVLQEKSGSSPGTAAYLTCQVAELRGDLTEAQRLCQEAVDKAPSQIQFRVRLARLLRGLGKREEALSLISAALRLSPEHKGALIERSLLRFLLSDGSAKERATAEAALLAAKQQASRAEQFYGALALAEVSSKDSPKARSALKDAPGLCPKGVVPREELAAALLGARDVKGAEREAREVLRMLPSREPARMLLARALLARGQGVEAMANLEAFDKTPTRDLHQALLLKARALLLLDQTLVAQEAVNQALAQKDKDLGEATLLAGRILLSLSDLNEARTLLSPMAQGASGSRDQQMEARLLLARVQLAARPPQRKEALFALEWLAKQAPQLTEAQLLRARLLRQQGQVAEAIAVLSSVLLVEDIPEARRDLAGLLFATGDARAARLHYDELLKEGGDNDVLLLSAQASRLSGDPEGAFRLLSQIERVKGETASEEILVEKARVYLAKGQPAEVVTLLREAASSARGPLIRALLIRGLLLASGPKDLALCRGLLQQIPTASRKDPEVQEAEILLLGAEGQDRLAALGKEALKARLSGKKLNAEEEALLARLQ